YAVIKVLAGRATPDGQTVACQTNQTPQQSKLKHLVPSIGTFFTPLALHDAFVIQDAKRSISRRRFVAPSFNDVRLILNTAQLLSLTREASLELMTFDGDLTLYDDGESLQPQNPVIERILRVMSRGVKVGIVTAAGYTEARRYYERLFGLLDTVQLTGALTLKQTCNLVVMGGEANYLFEYAPNEESKLKWVPRDQWALEEMKTWSEQNVAALLDVAEKALKECVQTMKLDAILVRKDRAVGIVPKSGRFAREQLEETVLVTQKILEMSEAGKTVPFCAFNGGNDVFVDIGDKSYGVAGVQNFFAKRDSSTSSSTSPVGHIPGSRTLHVGDQFLSAGSNDFKARLACTTAWIASPAETVALLDEVVEYLS
ncbi:MAG: hypothetical protein Q9162_007919, partial [Coniocarpon cinnabarinum]